MSGGGNECPHGGWTRWLEPRCAAFEREILFAPLTGLEVMETRVEGKARSPSFPGTLPLPFPGLCQPRPDPAAPPSLVAPASRRAARVTRVWRAAWRLWHDGR